MAEERKISPAVLIAAAGLGLGMAAIVGMVALAQARGLRADVSFASISPYLELAYYLNPQTESWELVVANTRIRDGGTYSISVTQDCILTYNNYYYELSAGWNQIVWHE